MGISFSIDTLDTCTSTANLCSLQLFIYSIHTNHLMKCHIYLALDDVDSSGIVKTVICIFVFCHVRG